MANLEDVITKVSDFRGAVTERTDLATDEGVHGLQNGDTFVNPTSTTLYIYANGKYWGKKMTSTSTTSSTSTSTSTTTTTS